MNLHLYQRVTCWLRLLKSLSCPRDVQLLFHAYLHRKRLVVPKPLLAKVNTAGAQLTDQDVALLNYFACNWPLEGPVIELGSFRCGSTLIFAGSGRHVYAIDAWSLDVEDTRSYQDESPESAIAAFSHNIGSAGFQKRVTAVRGLTHNVGCSRNTTGAILFIDAGHMYEDMRGDLTIWTPHLMPDGLLLMHDVLSGTCPGVPRAASELIREGWRVIASAGVTVAFVRANNTSVPKMDEMMRN